jgi:putative protease
MFRSTVTQPPMPRPIPELLAPAGTLDAVRAAVANGASAVYLGAERFNARDEGAQLSLDEVGEACRLAHAHGARIYLTFNILFKPAELRDALVHLGECVDRGIDAAIVQDLGAVRLIRQVYPTLEIHGSTQMTVHDPAGARVLKDLGIDRVVLARENTIEDIRAIHDSVPGLGLEGFVHGALCISYSGQCFMSGMISERSANRGSCAQSCRKDYLLTDAVTGEELDRGYLISARDLAAYEHLPALAEVGIACLKIEGRKKKPEFVATVTRTYRTWLDRLADGTWGAPGRPASVPAEEVQPRVQIFSRGFTGGMYGGRAGRDYITRDQPDNRGAELGRVVGHEPGEILIEVTQPVAVGDGLGFEHPDGAALGSTGFGVRRVRAVKRAGSQIVQAIQAVEVVPAGWVVVRSSQAALLESARESYASLGAVPRRNRTPVRFTVIGSAGSPLTLRAAADGDTVQVMSEIALTPAEKRSLDASKLREQLGRLGETAFELESVDDTGLAPGLFLPVSALNDLRQRAVAELTERSAARNSALHDARISAIDEALGRGGALAPPRHDEPPGRGGAGAPPHRDEPLGRGGAGAPPHHDEPLGRGGAIAPPLLGLIAEVFTLDDARRAVDAGADEISLDLFLRHPTPPISRVKALAAELAARGKTFRIRTPTIIRPPERKVVDKWLALDTPLVSGHLGLLAELGATGRDIVADYATNCFNQHTAAELFRLGARRIVLSIELTTDEMAQVAAPWKGDGFEVFVYGRPEGMTLEHCVLSAAFEREPATCRDLCVQEHPSTELTDPAGYVFPVATDSACRNRLLHSRPVDGAEYLPALWRHGFRNYRLVFNVPGDPVGEITAAYRRMLDALAHDRAPDPSLTRAIIGREYTRGHFARAV